MHVVVRTLTREVEFWLHFGDWRYLCRSWLRFLSYYSSVLSSIIQLSFVSLKHRCTSSYSHSINNGGSINNIIRYNNSISNNIKYNNNFSSPATSISIPDHQRNNQTGKRLGALPIRVLSARGGGRKPVRLYLATPVRIGRI